MFYYFFLNHLYNCYNIGLLSIVFVICLRFGIWQPSISKWNTSWSNFCRFLIIFFFLFSRIYNVAFQLYLKHLIFYKLTIQFSALGNHYLDFKKSSSLKMIGIFLKYIFFWPLFFIVTIVECQYELMNWTVCSVCTCTTKITDMYFKTY